MNRERERERERVKIIGEKDLVDCSFSSSFNNGMVTILRNDSLGKLRKGRGREVQ